MKLCRLHERQGWLLLHMDVLEANPCGLHHDVTVAAGQCAGAGGPCSRHCHPAATHHVHKDLHSRLQVNVQVEIKDDKTAIPRNSLIEANQSGLIAESLIDITPQQPIPQYKVGTCLGASPRRLQKQRLSLRSKPQHAQ